RSRDRARATCRRARPAAAPPATAPHRRGARPRDDRRRRARCCRRVSSCRGKGRAYGFGRSAVGRRSAARHRQAVAELHYTHIMSAPATPAMRQYLDAKQQHRDAILLFRMGDFYEMFYEDALVGARARELTPTSRSKDASGGGIPMCGVPHHAVDGYIARLVKRGFRVAICDQVEDPRKAKGIVKREVVRVVSPGTLTDAGYLDAREPAFLMALTSRQHTTGVALLDLSTGEFSAAEYDGADGRRALLDELALLKPREIIVSADTDVGERWPELAAAAIPTTSVDGWAFDHEAARRTLLDQLRAGGLEGFGLDRHPAAVSAAGALVHHLRCTQKVDLAHVRAIAYRQRADALLLDPTTLTHLEILEGSE